MEPVFFLRKNVAVIKKLFFCSEEVNKLVIDGSQRRHSSKKKIG
jgi:hypothetical protein